MRVAVGVPGCVWVHERACVHLCACASSTRVLLRVLTRVFLGCACMGDVCTCVCTCLHVWVCQHTRVPVCVCARVCVLAPKGARGAAGASRPGSPPCPCVPTRSRAGGGVQDPPTHTPVTAPPATSKRPPRGEPPRPPPAAHGRATRGGTHGRWGLCPGTPPGATEPWGRVAVAVRALLLPPSAGGARSHPPVATGGLHGGSPSRVAPGHRRVTAWRRGSGDPSAWIADFGEVPLGQDPPPGPHP